MQQLGCRDMESYLAELNNSYEVRQHCELLMTVSISRFFRDRALWQALENRLLPELIEQNKEKIKVWSAGCACGEEVYSFKIVWDCLKKCFTHLPQLEILATDMNPTCLERGQKGIYPSSSLKEVQIEFRSIYFNSKRGGKLYEVKPSLKKDIVWKIHHLLLDPPGSDFHLIFLRNNLLTYYQDQLKIPALKKVLDSLAHFGLLIIGSHENLPYKTPNLIPVTPYSYIYKFIAS